MSSPHSGPQVFVKFPSKRVQGGNGVIDDRKGQGTHGGNNQELGFSTRKSMGRDTWKVLTWGQTPVYHTHVPLLFLSLVSRTFVYPFKGRECQRETVQPRWWWRSDVSNPIPLYFFFLLWSNRQRLKILKGKGEELSLDFSKRTSRKTGPGPLVKVQSSTWLKFSLLWPFFLNIQVVIKILWKLSWEERLDGWRIGKFKSLSTNYVNQVNKHRLKSPSSSHLTRRRENGTWPWVDSRKPRERIKHTTQKYIHYQ